MSTHSGEQNMTDAPPPDRATLRAALGATRANFHALLDLLTEDDWRRRPPGSAWTVGELLTHCVGALQLVPRELASVRRGEDFLALPPWAFNPLRIVLARLVARRESPASLRRKYDAACMGALRALETVRDDEWQRGARFYDEGYWTVEHIFALQPRHFAEHAAEIRRGLARD